MKKCLALLLILALSVSCLVGCGGGAAQDDAADSQQTETPAIEAEEDPADTEEPAEEPVEEPSASEPEIASVIVESTDGTKKLELKYNATYFDCTYEPGSSGSFAVKEAFHTAFLEQTDWMFVGYSELPESFCGGGTFNLYADYTAESYYDEQAAVLAQHGQSVSDLNWLPDCGFGSYVYEHSFNDGSAYFTEVIFELGGCVLVFTFNNGNMIDSNDTILDVDAFIWGLSTAD